MAGALAVASSAAGTRSQSNVYNSSGRKVGTVTTVSYNPTQTLLTGIAAQQQVANVSKKNAAYLESLESALLFDNDINSKDSYYGVAYAGLDANLPDYKVIFTDADGKQLTFMFTRSDRANVLNHWLDSDASRNSIIANYGFFANRFGLSYHYSTSA